MNFSRVSMLFLGAVLFAFAGCDPAPSENAPNGDVAVQIPVPDSQSGENKYSLQTVTLKSITTLREVRGRYAEFFYSPGLIEGRLAGDSPVAYFVKTNNQTYVAKDVLSLQMATIYFHMQSLITGAQNLGISIKAPFQVGLNTQIKGDKSIQANNAFFDGRSQAMLFVPYTAQDMPISVNAGIIAHEFFHSIFYSKVLAPLAKKRVSISQRLSDQNVHSLEGWGQRDPITAQLSDVELFNETYLRGMNEGLADFWGWAYTDDPDFLKWSLPAFVKARSLNRPSVAAYKTDREIENAINEAQNIADDPGQVLSNFIYEVGTPYARFLKELVLVKVKNEGLTQADSKKSVSQFVLSFIDNLGAEAVALKAKDKLSLQSLFKAVSDYDIGRQTKAQCELIIQYLNSPLEKEGVSASKYACVKEPDLESYKLVSP